MWLCLICGESSTISVRKLITVCSTKEQWRADHHAAVYSPFSIHILSLIDPWLDREPLPHAEVDEIYRGNIRRLIERGTFTEPAYPFDGARYQSGSTSPEEEDWDDIKTLWDGWGEDE
jgi:beta-ureidopropionase